MTPRQYERLVANKGRKRGPQPLADTMDRTLAPIKVNQRSQSPIEVLLADWLSQHLHASVTFSQQVKLPGHGRIHRVDCLLRRGQARIVLEADGEEFHNRRADEIRDFELLACAGVKEVWRFSGKALVRDVPAALARFVETHPHWFRPEVVGEFDRSGLKGQESFGPVIEDGSYEMPTPTRGRATYYGVKRSRPQ